MLKPTTPGSEILLEAHKLVNGPRQDDYGHPADDYGKVADIFETLTGIRVTVPEAILFMVAVKMARLRTNLDKDVVHHDSLLDAIGYLACLNMVVS